MGTPTAGYTRGVVTQFVRTEADIMTRSSGIMQTLMFILGVPREENRFDRDKYIKLTFSEEDKRLRRIFQKNLMTKLDLDFPYDTLSAAHMTKKNAEDLRVGIESLDPAVHPIKEQVDSVLSQGDKKKLNYLYCGGSIDGSRDSSTRARANSPGLNNRTSGQESSGNQTGVSDGSNDSSSTGKNGTSNSNSQINTPSGGGVGGSGGGGDGGGGGGGGGGLSDGSGGGSGEVDGNGGEDYSDGENQGDDEILKDGMTDGSNSASERIFGILQVFLASAAVLVTLVTTLFAVTPSF
ncbi:Peptidase M12A [Trinorchestia longiramus]|nr:Peptidase M12A [Trinorchestia longiramus]